MTPPEFSLIEAAKQHATGGNPAGAAACLVRAIASGPTRPAGYGLLGELHRLAGRDGEASRNLRRALTLDPLSSDGFCALAIIQLKRRALNEALDLTRRAVVVDPGSVQGWNWKGIVEHTMLDPVPAQHSTRRVVRLVPGDVAALGALGRVLTNDDRLQGDPDRAREGLRVLASALALAPANPGILENIANALLHTGRHTEATGWVRRVQRLDRRFVGPYLIASASALMQGRFETAHRLARIAVALTPGRPAAWTNLGLARQSLHALAPARRAYERALTVDPRFPIGNLNLATVLLQQGEFLEGWRRYEARWFTGAQTLPRHAPLWHGEPIAGARVLIVAEQGQGDTLHFIRYAPLVAARGARVVVLVPASLKRLVTHTPGIEQVLAFGEEPALPSIDRVVPMMSLPRLFTTTLDRIPALTPYLFAPDAERERWRGRVAALAGVKIGLVWAGDAHSQMMHAAATDRRRSLTLAELAPLANVPGISWVSLQKGRPASEAKTPPEGMALHDWMDEVRDFGDTAALAGELDLVITVDTSVAHLAGGLGLPTWVLSRYDGCWRWLIDRDDSPWYPNIRLFRQTRPLDWASVIEHLAGELARWIDTRVPDPSHH